jgi:thioredoxin 1
LCFRYSKEEKYKAVHFVKFDVDQLSKLADDLKIEAMPTFQMFKNGEMVDHVVEPKPDELASFIDKGMS